MPGSSRARKVFTTIAIVALVFSPMLGYFLLRPGTDSSKGPDSGRPPGPTLPSEPVIPKTPLELNSWNNNTTILPQAKRSWTVLFYVAYDNSIGPMEAWAADLRLLLRSGPSDEVNLVAFVDEEHDGDCRIVHINDNSSDTFPLSTVNSSWGDEVDSGNPAVLSGFLKWGVRTFPATHLNLHFLDHGGAWMGLCMDESSGGMLDAWEVRSVLLDLKNTTGQSIDVVSCDACYMADLEFGYELCDCAGFLVGLETFATGQEEPGNASATIGNWMYDRILGGLKERPDWVPAALARHQISCMNPIGPYVVSSVGCIYLQYSDAFGAADLGRLPAFSAAFDRLSRALLSNVTGPGGDPARKQFFADVLGHPESPPAKNTESFHGQCALTGNNPFRLYDVGDLLYRLETYGGLLCDPATVKEAIQRYDAVITGCVHGENAAIGEHPDATGLELFIPSADGKYLDQYADTRFARDTGWDEFLRAVQWTPLSE